MPKWPRPGAEELRAATGVLESGRLNYWTGEQGRLLESEAARQLGRAHAIAVSNGTVALELALRAFGIGPGDGVIVPSRTFIATASAVVAVGATPLVADIDPDSGNLTAETVRDVFDERVRVVVPVHLGGWPVDLDPLLEFARAQGLVVIEDCAQAHGGSYHGRPIGAGPSHAATFSFCQDKIVPTGDAGLVVLDDDDAYARAWEYKDHGKSLSKLNDPAFSASGSSFKWLHDHFGTNWRLDEISSALTRVGLAKLPVWHAERARNAHGLSERLAGIHGLRIPLPGADVEHAFYRLYGRIDDAALRDGWDRDRILRSIVAEGVPVQYGTCAEIYREAAFTSAGLGPAHRLPGAARAHDESIAFFVHPGITAADLDDTAEAVRKVFAAATT